MKYINLLIVGAIAVLLSFSSCVNDLEVEPIDPNQATANNVFDSPEAYKKALAKIYATYAISGQQGGGGGQPDIQGIDENFGNYLRQLWGLQELSTDEAIMAWDDATIKNFHWHTWAPNDVFISALYSRVFYTITAANEFIRTSNDGMGKFPEAKTDLEYYQAEARFLRAFSYWHAIDMFGDVPFVTEADLPGAFFPEQKSRSDLFTYIETELKDLENILATPGSNEYGRVDRVSAWMLLSKLYLNASVYIGQDKNTEAITYLKKVITEGGYALDDKYSDIFMADNHTSPEIIFPITFDGTNTQQYGGMTFLLHASNGGGMPLNGIDGGWGGIRAIKELPEMFDVSESDFTIDNPGVTAEDRRGMFFFNPDNWVWEIDNVGTFTEGVGVTKFKNISSDGGDAPNAHPTFVSTDFPMFRLGDAYLMYAEAVLRGGSGGEVSTAVGYVNDLIERAYGNTDHNISTSDMTLDFLLEERARELYWECHRRTDLIRFGKFTGSEYVWTWKGNVKEGAASESFRDLYPIPTNDLNSNPNLEQNDGYVD